MTEPIHPTYSQVSPGMARPSVPSKPHGAPVSTPAAEATLGSRAAANAGGLCFANDGKEPDWAAYAAAEASTPDFKEMVNRFLGWKLPQDFAPDAGISFDRTYAEKWGGYPQGYPVGTNLFTADQARAMFEYCVRPTAADAVARQPVDVEFKRLADTILQATTNGTRLEALRGMAELFDRATAVGAGGLDCLKGWDFAYSEPAVFIETPEGEVFSAYPYKTASKEEQALYRIGKLLANRPTAKGAGGQA